MKTPMSWTLAGIWNHALEGKPRTVFEPRERIWASELYNSDIDLFLKLRGEPPTNFPNSRSMRKFEAGNMHEWFVKLILARIGIFQSTQDRVEFNKEGLLQVTGKIDFLAGGTPKLDEKIGDVLGNMELPELYQRQVENMVEHFQQKFPDGLMKKIVEVKSVSTFAFDKVEKTGKPLKGHDIQAFHYAYNTGNEVALVYLCRDDLRMYEIPILPEDKNLEQKYLERIKQITLHHQSGVEPAKEPFILYDDELGKFSKNFGVEYSSYLTKLYGFNEPAEYDAKVKPLIGSWNRVLGRVAKGAKMTPKNEEILKQIEAFGFNLETIKNNVIELASKGLVLEEEVEE